MAVVYITHKARAGWVTIPPVLCLPAWGTVGGVTRADLDKEPHEVAAMFDGVAQRYDLTNTVLVLRAGPGVASGNPGGPGAEAR